MKIAIASDHAGFDLKEKLKKYLSEELSYEVIDFGPDSSDSVDYPDFAHQVASKVSNKEFEKGVLVCGSGIGMSMTANKHKDVRAVVLHDTYEAEMSRQHNDANVACFGARALTPEVVKELLKTWLDTEFAGGRHERRVEKIEI